MVRTWIEFHDSEMTGITASGGDLIIDLIAVVHRWEHRDGVWRGTGWLQPVRLILKNTPPPNALHVPVELSDGGVECAERGYKGLIPLPFTTCSPVRLTMHTVRDERLDLAGDELVLTEAGPARFLEELPADLLPRELDRS